jgi:nucleoside-diphosphate-sugar epimerase
LINFLCEKIRNGESFDVWKNSSRNLIDIEDCYKICSYFIDNNILKNTTVNVATNKYIGIINIVKEIEAFLQKKAVYNLVDKGASYSIDISDIQSHLRDCQVSFGDNYLVSLLNKYY